jgi:O-antigen/teichoic acid export membrane protein
MKKEGTFGQNAALSVLAWVASGIAAFVCVPIEVRGLGPDAFGLIALVTALTGYVGLLDLGLGQALLRYLSYYRALGEGRPMIAIVRVALVWFAGAGIVAGLLLSLNASWLATHVLSISPGLLPTAVAVIRLSAVNLVFGLLISVGSAVPTSFLRYDIAAGMTGVFSTASWIGPAVVVVLGYGAVGVAWFYLASNVVALVFYTYFGRHLFRSVPRGVGPEWREIRHKVLSFAGLVAINRVGSTAASQTNRLMVGVTTGTAAAAYYQVPNVLASKMTELLSKIAGVLFPMGSALVARGDHEGIRRLYTRSSRLLFLLNASMAVPVAIYARPLLEFWVGPLYAEKGTLALIIFAAAASLNAASLGVGCFSWAAARPGVNLFFASLNSVISLAAIYPLALRFGVAGAAAASLLGALSQPFFIHYGHRRILGLSSRAVFRHCYLPSMVGAGVVGVVSSLLLVPRSSSLAVTIALLLTTGLLSISVSGVLGAISREELRQMRDFVLAIRRRFGS